MDIKRIEELIEAVKDARVSEISVRRAESAIVVRKAAANGARPKPEPLPHAGAPVVGDKNADAPAALPGVIITAPMVGIFRTNEAVKGAGAHVKNGQAVGSIESMKLMNDVRSCADGKVVDVHVEDGTPVEFGQVLFRVE